MSDPLRELGVEAGASLLDEAEVEAGGVRDRLEMVGLVEVGVATRNRREPARGEARDGCGSFSPKSGFRESLR